MVEPPRAATLSMAMRGADFCAMQEVAFADDTHEAAARIDNRRAADTTLCEQPREGLDRHVRINRNDISRHYIHRAHSALPTVHHK